VEFRILGPFEVVRSGESVPLGGTQKRALLALLALHSGEPVSIDRLIDELWGERPPRTAAKTVQVYVSQLRKALGSDVIVTREQGYMLAVERDQLDVSRFEALCATGRRALADGDTVRAAERLASALALWRGEPLAEFAYEPFAQRAIARLVEARMAALEDRIDADLALGRQAELISELELLVAANPLRERLRGQLMIALYRAGRQADALGVYRQASELLREELGLEPIRALRELERLILEQDASLDGSRQVPIATRCEAPVVCPFKGLAFFDRSDAEFFFGRERLIADLVARLAESPLVGVLGPSGIGKSSLLRAGVLPALSGGALPGSAGWRQVLLRPGEHPCAGLAHAVGGDELDRVLARLASGQRIVVAVDQLEELFTVCEREEERAAFLAQLVAAACDDERRALVVVSLRADFYGHLGSYPRFAELLSRSHVLLGPMDRDELVRAIEQPAARAELDVERPLVDALVSDVIGEPGGLPLLSTALLELWRARDGRALSYSSYRTSGGVRGAVARLAEAAYTQLGEAERRIARSVMLRLASGEDGALARRRAPVTELQRIDDVERVLAALTDARLLTASDGEVELSHEALLREWPRYRGWLEEDRVERRVHAHLTVAALEWNARGRDPVELYRGARLAGALDWTAQHRDELTALELDFIQSSRLEAEHEARRQRSQNRRLRGLLLGVGALLVVAVVTGIVALVKQQSASNEARVALARQLGAEAVNEPRLDLAMLLAREAVNLDRSPQTDGTLLATLQRSPAVIGTFALPVDLAPLLSVSPDGRTLAVSHFLSNEYLFVTGPRLGDVRFYDPRTHAVQRVPLTDFGGALAPVYSGDGSLLAYPTDDVPTSIAVRDAHTLALVSKLAFDPFQIATQTPDTAHASILIAPDDRRVYCAYRVFDLDPNGSHSLVEPYPGATYLARWSLPSGRRLSTTRIDSGAVLAVRLIDGGARLLVVDARTVSVFDAGSLHRLSSLAITPAPAAPSAAAISPDGRTIAIGSQTGQVSFIDAANGQARAGIGARSTPVTTVTYSPGGRAVASTGSDNRVIVWDPQTATSAEVLTAPAEQVQGVAFSPDGSTLYTSSLGGVLLEWDLTGVRSFGRRFALGPGTACCGAVSPLAPPLALSPDGTTFAVRLGSSTVGLFSARTLQQQASFTIRPKGSVITALAWSPSRPELAVGGYSGLVQLWQVNGTPRLARSLRGLQPLVGLPEAIQAVAFSPDGQLLAASDSHETLESPSGGALAHYGSRLVSLAIWRASNGRLVAPPRDLGTGPAHYTAIAFSRDGRLLAVSLPDTTDDGGLPVPSVQVLDPTTGQVRQTLRPLGADDTVSLAFAPDGTLATGTQGGIVQLWNPTSGAQIAGPVAVAAGPVTSIAFDSTGQRLATTGKDGTVKLWFTSTLQQEGTTLDTDHGAASTAAFEPNGSDLLVIDDHGNAFTWQTSLTAWEQRACAIAARNLTAAEWAQYIPGRSYATVCP
jgi:DNA-binding SARP family transcriptional activator/WD40 repeat protein